MPSAQKIKSLIGLAKGLPLTYFGGKKKLFPWLAPLLAREMSGAETVLDGFCGSGIISALLTQLGLRVFSCDMLESAHCLTVTLAQNPGEVLASEDLDFLCSHRCVDGTLLEGDDAIPLADPVASRFPHVLTSNESLWLARTVQKLEGFSPFKRLQGLAAIRGLTCLIPFGAANVRDTYRQRISQKDKFGTHCLGHYLNSSYEFELEEWFRRYVDKLGTSVGRLTAGRTHDATVFRGDIIPVLGMGWAKRVDVAYFDPPYGGNRKQDYTRRFALSECVLGASPVLAAAFSRPTGHERSLRLLLEAASQIPKVIFSYDSSSWTNIEKIVDVIEGSGRRVRVESVEHAHGKVGLKSSQKAVTESLIIGER